MPFAGPTFIRAADSGLEFWLVQNNRRGSIIWEHARRVCQFYGGDLATEGIRNETLRTYAGYISSWGFGF